MKNKITELIKILDTAEFSTDPEKIKKYNVDWRGVYIGKSNLVIFPTSVKKLSKVLSFCQKKILELSHRAVTLD